MSKCCNIVGGRIEFRADGKIYETEGDVVLYPAGETREARATNTGRPVVAVTPAPYRAEITFTRACGADVMELWKGCDLNVTITEADRGIRHYLTQAALSGEPKVNLTNGSVEGVEVVANQYQQKG